ncbi:MAG: protein kinase [Streptosporangiaceae bacterium]|nr:protein kinase [Streptosporangiaceae bacterium]
MGNDALLAGRYRLISPLGRGGMGQVWEGQDERLGRPVAVKLLTYNTLATHAKPDDGVRRFTREAAVTAGLPHPGVPAIYDAGEYDGGLYLVMELVGGCTVSDLIAEQGPLPVPWVAAIGAQVAAVLAVAHERGVIHRDIKPANVMVTADGTAKILDFGVAGIVSQRITSTGVAVGTPAYMAPEQLHNLPTTPRTDLYALGCLLYELLSGEPVFSATSPAALMRMHLEQAPAPLSRGDLDVPLVQLVWQLLQKDPAWRPSGAREVYDRLLPYVGPLSPLGDISPSAGDASGMQLYSRLLVRVRPETTGDRPAAAPNLPGPPAAVPNLPGPPAAVPNLPGPPAAVPNLPGPPAAVPNLPGPPAAALPRPRRALRHSLWILPTLLPLGMGAWMSFGYIAIRHGRGRWLAVATAYLALMIAAFCLILTAPDSVNGPIGVPGTAGVVLAFAIWPAGFIHALWVNFTVRLPLITTNGRSG